MRQANGASVILPCGPQAMAEGNGRIEVKASSQKRQSRLFIAISFPTCPV